MTQFNYCKTTFCRHLLFLVLALSFGFTAQAKDCLLYTSDAADE